MKKLTLILIAMILVLFTLKQVKSQVINNVALSSLGATAEDNGSFDDYGIDQDAMLTIDGDITSYWAGLQSNSPQKMWIFFDQSYSINKVYIDEMEVAYINTGFVEFHDETGWHNLFSVNKISSDLFEEFSDVIADGIRLTVETLTAPSSWYNQVACVYSFEVNGQTIPYLIENNVALSSLGATAEDNGSFDDYGIDQDAMLTIDGDITSYWAGLQSNSPQKMWIFFDQSYSINKVYIDEMEVAYINTGFVEFHDETGWHNLFSVNKISSDLFEEFSDVIADGIRLTVETLTAPSSWYNQVACVYSFEVNGKILESIISTTENKKIFCYPNPTQGHICVTTNLNNIEYFNILNYYGNLFETKPFNNVIDISNFPDGLYFLKFFDRNHKLIQIEKILKQ